MKIQLFVAAIFLALAQGQIASAESQTMRCHGEINVEVTVQAENNQEIQSRAEFKISGLVQKSILTNAKATFWSKGTSLMDSETAEKMDTASIEATPRGVVHESAFAFYHSEGNYEKIEGESDSFVRIDGREFDLSCQWK